MEIENHNLQNEINTQKIKDLNRQVKDLNKMEKECMTNQEEYSKIIADLESSLGSQQHNEYVLNTDLEKAREEIKNSSRRTQKIKCTSRII